MGKHKYRADELLSELIAFDTTNLPGNELPCAQYLEKTLREAGFHTQIQILPSNPNRANVVASIGNSGGKTLIYNGHIDVVPAGGVPSLLQQLRKMEEFTGAGPAT